MVSEKRVPQRIALFTDFGESGPYTGQMEAMLYARGVEIPIIRLISDAPTCNPRASAYLLSALARYQPKNTLFLSVVDPGVGGDRLPLLVRTASHWFIGPDNGLFSQVISSSAGVEASAIEWQPENLSASFHGRDLFAPVAAACTRGEVIKLAPKSVLHLVGADWSYDLKEVIYIDHYGNAFSGIRADTMVDDELIQVGGFEVVHARTFSEMERGRPFWYRNSIGLVEIAVNQGRADKLLGLKVGAPLEKTESG